MLGSKQRVFQKRQLRSGIRHPIADRGLSYNGGSEKGWWQSSVGSRQLAARGEQLAARGKQLAVGSFCRLSTANCRLKKHVSLASQLGAADVSLASHLSVLGVSLASQMFGSRQTRNGPESFRNWAPIGAEFLSYKVLVQTSVKAIGELPEECAALNSLYLGERNTVWGQRGK